MGNNMRSVSEVQSFLKKQSNHMRKFPTEAERKLKMCLEQKGIRFQFQSIHFSQGVYRIFDFYFPRKKVIVEIDGPYHDPKVDAKRDAQLLALRSDWRMLRFTNDEILNSPLTCLKKIKKSLG